jgi:predicted Zn-ribbon and HTH transcriptional regulator
MCCKQQKKQKKNLRFDSNIATSAALNEVLQKEEWFQPIIGFLKIMEPISGVRPLFCIASTRVRELEIDPKEVLKCSKKFQDLMVKNPKIQPEVISEWLKKMEHLMLQH